MEGLRPEEVAILCDGTETYGVAAVLRGYADCAPKALFVCMNRGEFYDYLVESGCRVVWADGPEPYTAGATLNTIARLPGLFLRAGRVANSLAEPLRSEGIRLVHANWFLHWLIALFLRRRGFLTIWQIHNNIGGRAFGLSSFPYRLLARYGASLLLPVSEAVAAQWRPCRAPVAVVRTGAMLRDPPTESRSSKGALRCVIGGRLMPDKGHHVAIDIIARARRLGARVSLDIVGGPITADGYCEALRRQIADEGLSDVIRLLGPRKDLRDLHRRYDVALQCRLDPEPCSVWVSEALADGLVVIASASGGTPELITDGLDGLLYPPGNAEHAARLLVGVGNSPALRKRIISRNVRRRYQLSMQRFVEETFEAYSRALEIEG